MNAMTANSEEEKNRIGSEHTSCNFSSPKHFFSSSIWLILFYCGGAAKFRVVFEIYTQHHK